jgi:hypothetical protein
MLNLIRRGTRILDRKLDSGVVSLLLEPLAPPRDGG